MEMVDKTFYNSIRSIILTEDAKDLESLELVSFFLLKVISFFIIFLF